MWTVYLLSDPRDPTVGYVGQTTKYLAERLRSHANGLSTRKDRTAAWMRAMRTAGVTPTASVLQRCRSQAAANRAECAWIERCRTERTMTLVNDLPGGYFVRDEQARRANIRAALSKPGEKARKGTVSRKVIPLTWRDPKIRKRRVRGMKRSWTEARKAAARERWADPVWRAQTLAKQKAALSKPEERERRSRKNSERYQNPRERAATARQTRATWQDPSIRDKRLTAQREAFDRRRDT